MISTPVHGYLDFSKTFVVETNACGVGIVFVLMQEGRPISYYSSKLLDKMQQASTYTKELYAITQVVCKWRHYLLANKFVMKTNHSSLKNLPSQVIQPPKQQKFLYKLLGFDYSTEYKLRKENVVADGLSRMYDDESFEEEGSIFFSLMTYEFSTRRS